MSGTPEAPALRRVITGHDNDHTAVIAIDDGTPNIRRFDGGTVSRLVWSTDKMPADIGIGPEFEDLGARKLATAPPKNGSRFAVIDFAPFAVGPMHRTETIDYVVVVSGTIEMHTDDGVATLNAGDVVVQRGTNHSWVNRTAGWVRLAFVLLDAEPINIGSPIRGAQSPQ